MVAKFTPAADAEVEMMPWGRLAWLSRPRTTGAKSLVVIEARLNEGGGHSFHKHPEQEELIYVIEGRVEQWLDHERRIMQAGDSVFVPAGTVHATFNIFPEDAKVVAILGPCVGPQGYHAVDVFEEAPWKTLRK